MSTTTSTLSTRKPTDIDECQTGQHNCTQLCQNLRGSFRCSCTAGYTPLAGGLCQATNVPPNETASLIYVNTTAGIYRKVLDTTSSRVPHLLLNATNILTLEFSHRNRTLCARFDAQIRCVSIDDPSQSWTMPWPDLMLGTHDGEQMRLDWTSGNWYFLYEHENTIMVCNAAMRHCTIVVRELADRQLLSLALDPTRGLMFYSTWRSAAIVRANMDGSGGQRLHDDSRMVKPMAVALDLAMGKVCWMDMVLGMVECSDYDGGHRRSIKLTNMLYMGPNHAFRHPMLLYDYVVGYQRVS